jgi:hypothetical protein
VVTNVEEDGKSTDYHPGECYFEGGDKSHVPANNGDTWSEGCRSSSCQQLGAEVHFYPLEQVSRSSPERSSVPRIRCAPRSHVHFGRIQPVDGIKFDVTVPR